MEIDLVKEKVAEMAVRDLPEKGIVGLGSGSTAAFFIKKAAVEYFEKKLSLHFVATSKETERLALQLGLPLLSDLNWGNSIIDVTFDGADAVDEEGSAVKGAGGALLREKIVAFASKKLILMVDERKWCRPYYETVLPLEVIPFGYKSTLLMLQEGGFSPRVRMNGNTPYLTADNNYIVDIFLTSKSFSIPYLDELLRKIPGIIETGFFYHFATEVIIGYTSGLIEKRKVKDVPRFRSSVV